MFQVGAALSAQAGGVRKNTSAVQPGGHPFGPVMTIVAPNVAKVGTAAWRVVATCSEACVGRTTRSGGHTLKDYC
jgi:hypothetical protein